MSAGVENLLEEILERLTILENRVRENGRMIQRLEECVCDWGTPDERIRQAKVRGKEEEQYSPQANTPGSTSKSETTEKISRESSEEKARSGSVNDREPEKKEVSMQKGEGTKPVDQPVFFDDEDSDLQFDE